MKGQVRRLHLLSKARKLDSQAASIQIGERQHLVLTEAKRVGSPNRGPDRAPFLHRRREP
jgi:hypothetical protein